MRKQRKAKKEARDRRINAHRQNRSRGILVALGIWNHLKDTSVRDRFLEAHYPYIEISLGENETRSEEVDAILRELETALDKATFDCPLLGVDFPVNTYFSSVKPLMDLLLKTRSSRNAELQSFLMEAKERTRNLDSVETAATAISTLFHALDEVLIKYGRINHRLYFLELQHGRKSNDKWFVRFILLHAEPKRRMVKKAEAPRPAFRCGQPSGLGGIDWVEWPSSVMGLTGENRRYPVFVQDHALDNLYGRNARALIFKDREWLVHDYLWQALRNPKLIPMKASDKYLVEYNFHVHKIGYLVAHRIDEIVLVETFLFLTMDGTPEGDALLKNLGLARKHKIDLQLDKIETFLFTDVHLDPELVTILEANGCGHLFRILPEFPRDRCRPGYADEIRKHLGLGKRGWEKGTS